MTERWEQPEPARPAAARTFSQMSDAERAELLSAQDKANTATPGLQTALTLLPAVAALAALVAVGIFMASHFYHVGVWGTRASFYRLFDTFDALGWLVAACGLAVLVLMVLQRRRIDATYPK